MKAIGKASLVSLALIIGGIGYLSQNPKDQVVARLTSDSIKQRFLSIFADGTDAQDKRLDQSGLVNQAGRYWEQVPNTSESFGKNFEETGPRQFLNQSQVILQKALKNHADRELLKTLFLKEENYQTIVDHYKQLPDQFYFVEEATRVKMLNFLISSIELGGEWQDRSISVMRQIASENVNEIHDVGLAQSVAGDVIRSLAAISKHNQTAYEDLKEELLDRGINTKVLAYFEQQKTRETSP